MRKKAVIFDLDGTLLDTEVLSDRAMFLAFEKSLSDAVREELRKDGDRLPWELKRRILGLRGSEWIPIVFQYFEENWKSPSDNDEPIPMPTVDEFWKKWEMHLNNLCADVEACHGALKLVEDLFQLEIPLAIATSSRREAVEKKRIKHEDMFQCIPEIITGDDVRNGKPSPDIYTEAARRLGVDPVDCIAVEDSLVGARSGKAAGCYVVVVPDTRMEKSVFEPYADEVLDSLRDFDFSIFSQEEENT